MTEWPSAVVAEQPPPLAFGGLWPLGRWHASVAQADPLVGDGRQCRSHALVGDVDIEPDDPAVDVGQRAGELDPGVHQQMVGPLLHGRQLR